MGTIATLLRKAANSYLCRCICIPDWHCAYKCNIDARSGNCFCGGKAMRIAYSESVFTASVIQHVKGMSRFVFLSVPCLAVLCFPHYPINGTVFGKRILNIECVFWFFLQRLFGQFFILRRIRPDIIINVPMYSCKAAIILVRFQ
jgi:hypothetical protein